MAESELYRKGREIRRQELTEMLLQVSGQRRHARHPRVAPEASRVFDGP